MSAAPIRLDQVPVLRHSADDDLLSIRLVVDDLIAPGEHYFNVTPAEAGSLIASLEVMDARTPASEPRFAGFADAEGEDGSTEMSSFIEEMGHDDKPTLVRGEITATEALRHATALLEMLRDRAYLIDRAGTEEPNR